MAKPILFWQAVSKRPSYADLILKMAKWQQPCRLLTPFFPTPLYFVFLHFYLFSPAFPSLSLIYPRNRVARSKKFKIAISSFEKGQTLKN